MNINSEQTALNSIELDLSIDESTRNIIHQSFVDISNLVDIIEKVSILYNIIDSNDSNSVLIFFNEINCIDSISRGLRSGVTKECLMLLQLTNRLMSISDILNDSIIRDIHSFVRLIRGPEMCLYIHSIVDKLIKYNLDVIEVLVDKEQLLYKIQSILIPENSPTSLVHFNDVTLVSLIDMYNMVLKHTTNIYSNVYSSVRNAPKTMIIYLMLNNKCIEKSPVLIVFLDFVYNCITLNPAETEILQDENIHSSLLYFTENSYNLDNSHTVLMHIIPIWNELILNQYFIDSFNRYSQLVYILYGLSRVENSPLDRILFLVSNMALIPEVSSILLSNGAFLDIIDAFQDFSTNMKDIYFTMTLNILNIMPDKFLSNEYFIPSMNGALLYSLTCINSSYTKFLIDTMINIADVNVEYLKKLESIGDVLIELVDNIGDKECVAELQKLMELLNL